MLRVSFKRLLAKFDQGRRNFWRIHLRLQQRSPTLICFSTWRKSAPTPDGQRRMVIPQEEYLQLTSAQQTRQFYNLEKQYNRDQVINLPYRKQTCSSVGNIECDEVYQKGNATRNCHGSKIRLFKVQRKKFNNFWSPFSKRINTERFFIRKMSPSNSRVLKI